MQAWVTNAGLSNSHSHSHSQPVTSASGFDNLGGTQKRHVYQTQPLPSSVQDNTQPPSRSPIINANADRVAASITAGAATRIPPRPSRLGHYREGSLPMTRARTIASSSATQATRPPPFWEGSTIEGSLASDTASNVDVNSGLPSNYHAPVPEPSHKQREIPRHRPYKREPPNQEDYPPFILGPSGVFEQVGMPLTRSASTPDARNHRGGFKRVAQPDSDQYSEDSPYQTSPEKVSPSNKRLHHSKQLPIRTSQRGSFSERATSSPEDNPLSPTIQHAYQNSENGMEESQPAIGRLRVKTHEPHRSTIFADTDTPVVSHPDSEDETMDQQPTPKPTAKTKPQVARQLFSRNTKARTGLHESAMPRPAAEKHHSSSRKRSFELDYDDSALAKMNYTKLREEAFDFDPAQAEAQSVDYPLKGTLPEKLDHFLDKDQETQVEFFTKMSVGDWESSGDWFLERFADVTHRLKEARQAKRATIEKFENEIAQREEDVRKKINHINTKVADMKSKGEGLMKGQEIDCEDS